MTHSPAVAALYVETDGAYFGLEGVDPWDEKRDARLYAGPWPVVAHPPCNKWSPLAYINRQRIPNYVLGDDGGCFEAALRAVETYGGVLEHPAESVAWRTFGLPKPVRGGWNVALCGRPGWATEVDQNVYGHRARKRTWLYYVGGTGEHSPGHPLALDWREGKSDVIVSGFLHGAGTDESRRVRPKEASATPPAFRDALIALARSVVTKSTLVVCPAGVPMTHSRRHPGFKPTCPSCCYVCDPGAAWCCECGAFLTPTPEQLRRIRSDARLLREANGRPPRALTDYGRNQ